MSVYACMRVGTVTRTGNYTITSSHQATLQQHRVAQRAYMYMTITPAHYHIKLHCSSTGLHREHTCTGQLHQHTITSSHTAAARVAQRTYMYMTITPSRQAALQQHRVAQITYMYMTVTP